MNTILKNVCQNEATNMIEKFTFSLVPSIYRLIQIISVVF